MTDRALSRAEHLCAERGVRLTPQRRRVLEILLQRQRPLGAYDILEALDAGSGRRTAPPTVYRALEFLLEQGFIHRIASLQAYVTCIDPDHPHSAQLLVCTDCGRVDELEDSVLDASVAAAARARGFEGSHHVVEVTCRCKGCDLENTRRHDPPGQG